MINNKTIHPLKEWSGYIPFILIIIIYFILRKYATHSLLTPSEMSNMLFRISLFPYLILLNIKLILVPYKLHSFIIGYPENYLIFKVILGILFSVLIFLFLWKKHHDKLFVFTMIAFFILLFPVSNIIPTSSVTLISMRWLYFPMTFLMMAASSFLFQFMSINRRLAISVIGLILVYLGIFSYILNKNLWHDEEAFFKQEVINLNNMFYADGLALRLFNQKKYKLAEKYFRIAINSRVQRAINNITYSSLLNETNRPTQALSCLKRAESLYMTQAQRGQFYHNMGVAYFQLKDLDMAIKNFRKAVIYSPNEAPFWANLGGAYGSIKDYNESVKVLEKGLKIRPDSIEIKRNLAVSYIKLNNFNRAFSILETIPPEQIAEKGLKKLLRNAKKGLASYGEETFVVK